MIVAKDSQEEEGEEERFFPIFSISQHLTPQIHL
jgi:hypothetical protein